jgi:CubicO group peptidase (beta-lactamase class C family)
MKHLLYAILFIFSFNAYGQRNTDSLSYRLDEYFSALTAIENFNGNVIVSMKGKILLDNVYNMKAGIDSLTVKRESKFIIASVSKVFIKFALLKLVEQKRINLSGKLNQFIADFPNGNKISIEHLIHHKSGLPRELTDYKNYESLPLAKIVELSKLEKLQYEPGTQTLYSNVGYFLLHYIIEKASKNGYNEFIEREILKKLNLNNTGEFNTHKNIQNFAFGFDREDGKIIPTSQSSINRFETGNYFSTIEDLYKFSNHILSGKALKEEIALNMFGKDSLLQQSGGRSGYRSYFYKNLKTDVTIIFLSNYTDIPFQDITDDVLNIIEGKPYDVPQKVNRIPIPLSREVLSRYTGKYVLEADTNQIFTIVLDKDNLVFVDGDNNRFYMIPENETSFFDAPGSRDSYIFTLNKQTNKYDLTLLTEGVRLRTKRIE